MDDIVEFRKIVAQNIYYLRTANKMKQSELGEKLNYSDKAISKWERGDGLPDAFVLQKISKIFGVSVDYLLVEHTEQDKKVETKPIKKAKRMISKIVLFSIITIAVLLFVVFYLSLDKICWQLFVFALPLACITELVFSWVWENGRFAFLYTSALVWSIIATVYVALFKYNFWMLFLIGIPLQIIVFLCFRIRITITISQKEPKTLNNKDSNDKNSEKSTEATENESND